MLPVAIDAAPVRSLRRALGGALALLTLASFGILLSRTLELNGGVWETLWPDIRLALTVTHFGHIWWWRIPSLLLAWAAWAAWAWGSGRRGVRSSWTMAIAAAAIALTRSETGHPADHGDFTLAVWIDWLHILAAGTWVGSLFGMTVAVFPRLLREGKGSLESAAQVFQRLSTLSGVALAVLVGCGIFNALQQLDSFADLWMSRYGIILDAKLALVLAMILIGAHNRYIKVPRLLACAGLPARTPLGSRWLRGAVSAKATPAAGQVLQSCARAVLIESLLGLAVIGATGTLIHAMPPADMPSEQASTATTPQLYCQRIPGC